MHRKQSSSIFFGLMAALFLFFGVTVAQATPGDPCKYDFHCDAGEYCHGGPPVAFVGTCRPEPLLIQVGGNGPGCGDIGVAHPSPGYLVKYTVYGRPGAAVWKYNQHTSCSSPAELAPESPMTIPASGELEVTVPTSSPIYDCSFDVLGKWASYVVVDGRASNSQTFKYYNSLCPSVDTCSEATYYCP